MGGGGTASRIPWPGTVQYSVQGRLLGVGEGGKGDGCLGLIILLPPRNNCQEIMVA